MIASAEMASELEKSWVGPMPVREFLDAFLPVPADPLPVFNKKYFNSFGDYRRVSHMYNPMCKLLENSGVLRGLQVANTSDHPGVRSNAGLKHRPDIAFYPAGIDLGKHRTHYEEMDLIVEFKCKGEEATAIDPFQDPPLVNGKGDAESGGIDKETDSEEGSHVEDKDDSDMNEDNEGDSEKNGDEEGDSENESTDEEEEEEEEEEDEDEDENPFQFEPPAKARLKCRRQLAYYVSQLLSRQHRTHCFVVWLGDPYARLLRFDRDGAVVSRCLDYRKDGDVLLEFFWRFSYLSNEDKGRDPTVERVTVEEIKLAHEKLARWKPLWDRDIVKLTVVDEVEAEDGTAPHPIKPVKSAKILVWGTLAEPMSVRGRATKGYPGYDITNRCIVFVKDSWRSAGAQMQKETEILKLLNSKGVRNVPTLLCGDDLEGRWQQTVTDTYAAKDWNVCRDLEKFRGHGRVHIRFSTNVVGDKLETFQSPQIFLIVIRDAVIAHKDAYELCNVLHQDISFGNILITSDGKGGFLNDWGLARIVEDIQNGPRQKFRSGTWEFMSVPLLYEPTKLHTLQDDLESFFWVVTYGILRYMRFIGEHRRRRTFFGDFHEYRHYKGEEEQGGHGKARYLRRCPLLMDGYPAFNDFNRGFHTMVSRFLAYFDKLNKPIPEIMFRQNMSYHDALMRALPLVKTDFNSLELRNYDRLLSLFDAALSNDAIWPAKQAVAEDYIHFHHRQA